MGIDTKGKAKFEEMKAFNEAKRKVEAVLEEAALFDEEVKRDPVKYVHKLLDDWVDMRVELMELAEYLERSPNTPYIFRTQKLIEDILEKFS